MKDDIRERFYQFLHDSGDTSAPRGYHITEADWWISELTSYRASIYKELIDAIEGEKIECADTATAQIRNDTLEKLKKRICA